MPVRTDSAAWASARAVGAWVDAWRTVLRGLNVGGKPHATAWRPSAWLIDTPLRAKPFVSVSTDLSDDGGPRYTPRVPGARLSCMNARVDHLLHEALELPDDERCALVVALLDSIEGSADPSISQAWRDEVRNRRKALREGAIQATPWADAKARLSAM